MLSSYSSSLHCYARIRLLLLVLLHNSAITPSSARWLKEQRGLAWVPTAKPIYREDMYLLGLNGYWSMGVVIFYSPNRILFFFFFLSTCWHLILVSSQQQWILCTLPLHNPKQVDTRVFPIANFPDSFSLPVSIRLLLWPSLPGRYFYQNFSGTCNNIIYAFSFIHHRWKNMGAIKLRCHGGGNK